MAGSSDGAVRVLLYFSFIIFVVKGGVEEDKSYQEFSAGRDEKALFPSIFNLATHAEIRVTSTCGQLGPEYYCKLVEHVFLRQPQCDICDANDHNANHPIDYAIDGTRRWWQSPSLGNGLAYENVNITIDLRQEYQVAYVIVKAGISPRPGTWALERSLDGVTFTPWQYYAISDSECMRVFGVPATVGVPKFTRDDEVICTSFYSKLNPLEYGEVHTSLVNGRPGSNHTSPELQAFTKARFVRLRLVGLRTLHADLMVINRRDGKLDQSVTRRYFYSISDISIGGQCICYGHAESCPPEVTHGQFRCECRHNTYGESCSMCLPLYNQLPWRPGTHDQPNICQACQCFNHADRCVYDPEVEQKRLSVTPEGIYEGGGRCLDCQHNTDGVNCERCRDEYYRPANYSHYRSDACHPCDCEPDGSESNQCIRDETEASGTRRPGDCICRPGFGGRRCDRCAPGFRNHPVCEPCPCNQAGSLNFEKCEESTCICKSNVEGEHCDRCKPGAIYLDRANPLGCQSCFCFGKSAECREAAWNVESVVPSEVGWNLTDPYGRVETPLRLTTAAGSAGPTTIGQLNIFNADDYRQQFHGDNELYYFKVPMVGNWLNSYGANLHYYVYFVPHTTDKSGGGGAINVADVVLEGNDARIEYYSRLSFFPRENISVNVPLRVTDNWYDARSRRPIDKASLMRVLARVDNVFIRAKFHRDQLQSSIYGLRRETAVAAESGDTSATPAVGGELPIEVCTCPEHFEGNSCERCEAGYRRVGNQLYDGMCMKCECQDHSQECDPHTGHCLNCQHNTTGPRCEQCIPGHYGNPSLGGELGACRPCACPTEANSHSAQCILSELVLEGAAAADQDAFVCTACTNGYDGNKCEICADGFFGDSFTGICEPCNCNGNVDPAAIGNCDRSTGVCLRCVGNTVGDHCEECAPHHWGSAQLHSCHACNCHHIGAVSLQCASASGDCECHSGYFGRQCDRCAPGHGDVENGCPACDCDALGATGTECDEVSGQCSCKSGVYGKRCDKCVPSYFNFTVAGCQFCECDPLGAVTGAECHNVTGQCNCQPNVDGQRCERCMSGFFNITSGTGCQACECDKTGAVDDACDIGTGQCHCKPGVMGTRCDKCESNHWGLGEEGCWPCQRCPAPGQVCDAHTGECVCPPHTRGAVCEHCTPDAWNYHPFRGCQLCECDGVGAQAAECDSHSGQCKCKSGYVGHKCDQCEAGYFNFPNCEPCQCDLAGTDPQQCRGTICLCSNEGQCKCKKHVTGVKCDQCAVNSFSLEPHNLLGCTECFCFGRGLNDSSSGATCAQSDLHWRQIYSPDRRVHFEAPFQYYERRYNIHILRSSPLNYNSYPTNHTPLYWPLPQTFLGDRTLSYNGWIRFRIRNDANQRGQTDVRPDPATFRLFPQILLIGNHRIELEYTPPYGEIPFNSKFRIHLHESAWFNRISPQLPLTRKQFMVAFQNVQAIYVRATYTDVYRGDTISISELSLDVASEPMPTPSDDNSTPSASALLAIGVERCVACLPGYTGLSCQNPADGYCRRRDPDYLNQADDLALVGVSVKCACNGHSETCEPENCRCLNCKHNTVGDFCELCRPGYYGDASEGHEAACRKCACPSPDNSFSATCRVAPESGRGYVCDACLPGYIGQYCESCVAGYYGNPTVTGGHCALCACHTHGSVHGVCHNVTGECVCRPGVTGRDCSTCAPRHAFMDGVCSSCDRGCHKELMRLEDELEYALVAANNAVNAESGGKPIPRKRLQRIASTAASLDEILNNIKSSESDAALLLSNIRQGADNDADAPSRNHYAKQATVVEQEFLLLDERNNVSLTRLRQLTGQVAAIRAQMRAEQARSIAIANQLAQLQESQSESAPQKVHYLVQQAQQYLNSTHDRHTQAEKSLNYAKKNAEDAQALLREILSKKLDDTEYSTLAERHAAAAAALRFHRDTLWDRANAATIATRQEAQRAEQQLAALRELLAQIERDRSAAEKQLADANEAVARIRDAVLAVNDASKAIEDELLPAIREQRESFAALNNQYFAADVHSRIHEAQSHTSELEQTAQNLQNSFNAIHAFSMNALAASNAYNEIIDALKNATDAASVARTNAEESFNVVDPKAENEDSLVKLAAASLDDSNALSARLDAALGELSIGESTLLLQSALQRLRQLEADAEKNVTWIKDVEQLLDDHHERINAVETTVDASDAGMDEVKAATQRFADDVEAVKKRVDTIQHFNQQSIREAINNVTESVSAVTDAEQLLGGVQSRSDRHFEQLRDIRRDLNVLKEKINEAREKASKIRIGVKAETGGNCVREYALPMHPTPSNTISLKYRPALDSPNSLLFLTTTAGTRSQNREYIAVELRSKKIHVKWDIGDGPHEAAIMKRNIIYIPASDRYTWYHIEVKRIANTMFVSVVQKRTLAGEGERDVDEPTQVTVGTQPPDADANVIFNTGGGGGRNARLYIGHPDAKLTDALELATNHFHGTLGELRVDGTNVPLWVFDASSGHCDGAAGPPAPVSSGHMFRNGFAQVRMPINDRASALVSVQFSAYSPNGLLYFRGKSGVAQPEFVALHLRDGAVELRTNYGLNADGVTSTTVRLATGNATYADGRSHKVRVVRNRGEVALLVDQEAIQTQVDESAALDIKEPDHYVGGVPPNFDRVPYAPNDLQLTGFFGCIQSVKPNQVSELDLDNPYRAQHMEIGCAYRDDRLVTFDRLVGFPSPGGYVLAKGLELSGAEPATFSFNFRSRSVNAVLLYQSSELLWSGGAVAAKRRRDTEGNKGFFGFYLYDGHLVAHLGVSTEHPRNERPLLTTEQTYNDGLVHSVFLSRIGTEIRLRVDDRESLATTMEDESGGTPIGSSTNALLTMGGFPSADNSYNLATNEPLIGCLSDFKHNYERFPLVLEEHKAATLGACETGQKLLAGENAGNADAGNSDRKKSQQMLEPVAPTLSSIATTLESHDEEREHHHEGGYSLIGRSRRRESTCDSDTLSMAASTAKNVTAMVDGVRFGVSDSSHSRINFAKPYPDYANFRLSFSFRTQQRNAVLWVWASYKNYTRYFFLNLEHGFLTLLVKGHREPKYLQYRARRFNDDAWHALTLEKRGRIIRLQVDEYMAEEMHDAPNPKVMRKRMYVGGVISKHRKNFNGQQEAERSQIKLLPAFVGCIRQFRVDDTSPQDLVATSRDLVPCAHTHDVAYVHDGGFAIFEPLKSFTKSGRSAYTEDTIEVSLQFRMATAGGGISLAKPSADEETSTKTVVDNQLLFGLFAAGGETARLTVLVENGTLALRAHSAHLRLNVEELLRSDDASEFATICHNRWYRVTFRLLAGRSAVVQLDGRRYEVAKLRLDAAALDEFRALPVHVAGTTAPVSVAINTKSLHGCLKNVEFMGTPVAFETAKKSHKVVRDGCPFA